MLRDRKSSPFYLEHVAASTGVGRFKDLAQRRSSGSQTGAKTPKQQQQALANAMTLSPFYYPEELYSNKDQQCALRPKPQQPQSCRVTHATLQRVGLQYLV